MPGGTIGLPTTYLHHDGGTTVWRIEFLRRKNSGLTYTPKKSPTLAPASFIPVVTSIDPTWERVTIDELYSPTTTPRAFSVVEAELITAP